MYSEYRTTVFTRISQESDFNRNLTGEGFWQKVHGWVILTRISQGHVLGVHDHSFYKNFTGEWFWQKFHRWVILTEISQVSDFDRNFTGEWFWQKFHRRLMLTEISQEIDVDRNFTGKFLTGISQWSRIGRSILLISLHLHHFIL